MRRVLAGLLLTALACAAFAQTNSDTAARMRRFQDLQARFDRHEATLPDAERVGPGRWAEAKLALRKLRVRLGNAQGWYAAAQPVEAYFKKAEDALAALAEPAPAGAPGTGLLERAYVAESDGSPEPYYLYVPRAYQPDRDWPLLIFLHGYSPDLDVTNWFELMFPTVLAETCERAGVILLVPYGRSNTEFMGIGEQDVLKALEYARAEFRVDPRRIFMSGVSMGGSGAYSIACHRPDLFAGLVGLTGRVDYYLWQNVKKTSLPAFKQAQVDADYARELLPNLLHMPVLILHGAQDWAIPAEQSRLMAELLRGLGQRVQYEEITGTSHFDVWREPFMAHPRLVEMLLNARRPVRPETVRFRTMTLKYPQADWVRINGIATWGRMAEVTASVVADDTLAVQITNVARLTLGPALPERLRAAEPKVLVNGAPMKFTRAADGGLVIDAGGSAAPGGLRKTTELSGPIREAYCGPFLIVYPAAETPETAADRNTARRLAAEWFEYSQGMPPLRADAAVSEKDILQRHLILCGSAKTNRALAQFADKLPLRIEAERYVVGEREFPRAGNGAQFIYPNPLNPSRYILVVEGAPWGPQLQRNHKLDFLPDFIIYTAATEPDGTQFPTNRFLCAGYFNGRWQVAEESLWVNP